MFQALSPEVMRGFASGHRSYEETLARATRELGWNGRGIFQDRIADFHWAVRELRWRHFCIDLRDEVLSRLKDAFTRSGALLGAHPRLVVEGLPTPAKIHEAQNRLKAGGTRFDTLLELFI